MPTNDPLADLAAPTCDTCGTVIGWGEVICKTCEKAAREKRAGFRSVDGSDAQGES